MNWPMWNPGPPAWIGPEAAGYPSGMWYSPGYRSARIRARWCKILFAVVAVLAAIAALLCLQGFSYLDDLKDAYSSSFFRYYDWSHLGARLNSWADSTQSMEGWVMLVSLGLAAAFPAWFSRTVENLPPLAGGTPQHSPGESIGWWFVPIGNLFMPFTMVREAWRRYATPSRNGRGALLIAWWLAYNIGFTLAIVSMGMVFGESNEYATLEELLAEIRTGLVLGVVGFGLIVAAAVMAFLIVDEFGRRADERVAVLGLDAAGAGLAGQAPFPGTAPYPPGAYPPAPYPPGAYPPAPYPPPAYGPPPGVAAPPPAYPSPWPPAPYGGPPAYPAAPPAWPPAAPGSEAPAPGADQSPKEDSTS